MKRKQIDYINLNKNSCKDYGSLRTPEGVHEKLEHGLQLFNLTSHTYCLTLIFHEVNFEVKIYCKDYIFDLTYLGEYLHRKHGINNFDILYYGTPIDPQSHLYASVDAIINIKGGFDRYLQASWNKIMHSLNGNTEKGDPQIGRKYPIDKSHQRQNTRNNNKNVQINKNKNKFNGKKIFVKKEQASKVGGDVGLEPRQDILDMNKNDNKLPVQDKLDEASKTLNAPKKTEIEVDVSLDYKDIVGRKYRYDYVIQDNKPPIHNNVNIKTKWLGIFPRMALISAKKGTILYHIFDIICILIMITYLLTFIYDNLLSQFLKYCFYRGLNDNEYYISLLHEGRYNILTYKLFQSIIVSFTRTFFLVFFRMDVYEQYTIPYYVFTRILMCYVLINLNSYLNRYRSLLFTVKFITVGDHFYTRKIKVNEQILHRPISKELDARIESFKNFKLVQDANIYDYTEKLFSNFPIGYENNGKFKILEMVSQELACDNHLCDLELVSQILCPKNMSMSVSAEAIAERIANSANLGPFINTDRRQPLVEDVNNNSTRLAFHISMHHRNVYKHDMMDQLFRKGDRMRPFLPPTMI